jgi:hypothetical protein
VADSTPPVIDRFEPSVMTEAEPAVPEPPKSCDVVADGKADAASARTNAVVAALVLLSEVAGV